MNIGFDIDDTLTEIKKYNKTTCEAYCKETGKKFKIVNPKTGDIRKMYNWTKNEFEEFWHKVKQQFQENLPLKKDAFEVLSALKKQGHSIFIITRRFTGNPYERSEKWLNKHNLPYDKLIVNAGNKLEACKEHNIHLFLDDDIKICDNLNKNGIKAYVMNNYFNKCDPANSPRVNSLKEFYLIAKSYAQCSDVEWER